MCAAQIEAAIESCIYNSSHIKEFFLKYFDLMAQVISYRREINSSTSKFISVLRLWDGFIAPNKTNKYLASWTMNLGTEAVITPPDPKFKNIPEKYYYDVMLFGEWVEYAKSLKSGDIVILKNLHFFLRRGNKRSALVLHEGVSYGRCIIKIKPDLLKHYRCVKLMSDLQDVLDDVNPQTVRPVTNAPKVEDNENAKETLEHTNPECPSSTQSQYNAEIAACGSQDNTSNVISSQQDLVSLNFFALLAEGSHEEHNDDLKPHHFAKRRRLRRKRSNVERISSTDFLPVLDIDDDDEDD